MEKNRFLNLVQNFTSLTSDEATELDSLQKDYPYSQVIHNLATRAAHDNQLGSYNQLLNISAVYSTDRAVLKYIMTLPQGERNELIINTTSSTSVHVFTTPEPLTDDHFHGDDLIHEVEVDLARLKELKNNFELSWGDFEPSDHFGKTDDKKKTKKSKSLPVSEDDGLIEEIKSTKKEIDPEGEKQKEQLQIIDNFIKTSPSIPKGKSTTVVLGDLAENNNGFGDHIVSETLVDILLKQGKKEKAVEVLRKLIWKFPQKKAIFAAQIEELKK